MNISILEQELAPLNAQIEQTRKKKGALEGDLRVVETLLETFSADRQRFEALREVCNAFDKLGELKAENFFWEGMPEVKDTAGHLERVRGRVARFEEEISGVLGQQSSLQKKIEHELDELDCLYDEVREAHIREEQRQEEFVLDREMSPVSYRPMVMPWTKETESERQIKRAVLVALLVCFLLGTIIPLVKVPIQDPSIDVVEIPERLAMLVKKEPPKPPPPPPKPEPKQIDEDKKEPEKPDQPPKKAPTPEPPKTAAAEAPAARKKAESVGVLAFKNTFKDLMQDTPIAKLGTESLIKQSPTAAGQAVAQRSLVAMQAQGGASGGISNYGFSRNIGNGNADRIGGIGAGDGTGFSRVESSIAGRGEASPRPLSDGPGPGRTDEEIQIVFDRYKAALYRIYNTELRKDPTLRGKILLRISIEAGGEVSMCKVESTDLASPTLVALIVERIERFNFGPKEGVPKTTILYPIDFLPAG